ncbi:MAG: DUF6624 domain-containing protein [Gemmatimonadaceae bacterium]
MKISLQHIIALALSALTVARPLVAQSTAAQRTTCAYAPSAPWVQRQALFFDDSKHTWSDDTLRTALLSAAGITGDLRAPVNYGVQFVGVEAKLGAGADAMIARLKALGAQRGSVWPTRSVVGAAGVHAVYLLSQRDTALGRSALHRMMEAGPDESPAIDVAVFEDHMRLIWGRKQLYGTQFNRTSDGKTTLAAMEDSAHADLRRETAGLPPFKIGTCLAKTWK